MGITFESPGIRRRTLLERVVFAAAAVALTAASVWLHLANDTLTTKYDTQRAESKSVELPGIQLYLNTTTHIVAAHNRRATSIELRQGEIALEVHHDRARSVAVSVVGLFWVEDVGTKFAVKRYEDCATLSVTEGTAELRVEGMDYRTVYAGERIQGCLHKGHVEIRDVPVLLDKMQRDLAWEHGYLWFRGEPLREVVTDVNRYSVNPLYIEDPEIESIPITFTLAIKHVGDFKAAIQPSNISNNIDINEYTTGGSSVILLRAHRKHSGKTR